MMQKTIKALENLIENSKLLDIKFSIRVNENVGYSSIEELDKALAKAIENAEEVGIREVFS